MQTQLAVFALCLLVSSAGHADDTNPEWSSVPSELRGQWYVSRCEHGGRPFKTTQFADGVTVSQQHFWPSSMSRQQAEDESRLYDVRCSPTNASQVAVFWFCGVYRKKGDDLELLLSYRGQGLEGEAAKNWKWPTANEFDKPTLLSLVTLTRDRARKLKTQNKEGG